MMRPQSRRLGASHSLDLTQRLTRSRDCQGSVNVTGLTEQKVFNASSAWSALKGESGAFTDHRGHETGQRDVRGLVTKAWWWSKACPRRAGHRRFREAVDVRHVRRSGKTASLRTLLAAPHVRHSSGRRSACVYLGRQLHAPQLFCAVSEVAARILALPHLSHRIAQTRAAQIGLGLHVCHPMGEGAGISAPASILGKESAKSGLANVLWDLFRAERLLSGLGLACDSLTASHEGLV